MTKTRSEKIYCDRSGSISNLLNNSQHESYLPIPVITHNSFLDFKDAVIEMRITPENCITLPYFSVLYLFIVSGNVSNDEGVKVAPACGGT
jgi:hypothetical protein